MYIEKTDEWYCTWGFDEGSKNNSNFTMIDDSKINYQ